MSIPGPLKLLVLLLVVVTPVGGQASQAVIDNADPVEATPTELTPIEQARLVEALESFERAGLRTPAVDVVFSDDPDRCHGFDGFIDSSSTPARISICSERPYVLTHELAHAWIEANLSEERKAAYVAWRDLASWDDRDDERVERGTEDAAFILQQNLMGTPKSSPSPTWVERIEAYEWLTGSVSPLRSTNPGSA